MPGYKAYIRRKDLVSLPVEYSKKVYLVAEDPGKEPVQQISEDIAQYVLRRIVRMRLSKTEVWLSTKPLWSASGLPFF